MEWRLIPGARREQRNSFVVMLSPMLEISPFHMDMVWPPNDILREKKLFSEHSFAPTNLGEIPPAALVQHNHGTVGNFG